MQTSPERLGDRVTALLVDADNALLLSAASAWEIAIKHAIGRLPLPEPPEVYVPSRMARSGTTGLPVLHHHGLHVAALPPHHSDPFDRLLIAQARLEGASLVTADQQLEPYDVDLIRV